MADTTSLEVPLGAFLSLQQIFDKALAGLRRQGGPARNSGGSAACLYRGANGTACGIGQLIPDSHYLWEFENKGFMTLRHVPSFVDAMRAGGIDINPDFPVTNGLLDEIQGAHDAATGAHDEDSLAEIELSMRRIARTFKLTYTEA